MMKITQTPLKVTLTSSEAVQLKTFLASKNVRESLKVGAQLSLEISATGLGCVIEAQCDGHTADITDYEAW